MKPIYQFTYKTFQLGYLTYRSTDRQEIWMFAAWLGLKFSERYEQIKEVGLSSEDIELERV